MPASPIRSMDPRTTPSRTWPSSAACPNDFHYYVFPNLIFNIFDQIAYLSQAMTLEPGDLIFTGTPGGVGQSMKPPQFLKVGDTVRVEIDRLGAIEAKMKAEA